MTNENTQSFEELLESEEQVEETTSDEVEETEDAIIDSGEEATKPQDEVSDGETDVTEQTQAEEAFDFPQDWSEEHKTLFGGLTKEQKEGILGFQKGFQSDYTKKSQALAEETKGYEADREFAKDIRGTFSDEEKNYMMAQGINEGQAIHMAVANWKMENQDPIQFINQVASRNGIDLHQEAVKLVQSQQEMTPEQKQMNSLVSPLQKQVQELQQQIASSQDSATDNFVSKFMNMTDEGGNSKYPHMDKVEGRMAEQFQAEGKNIYNLTQEDWDGAYENACYSNPEIRQTLLQQQNEVKKEAERKTQDAVKALGAGKTVKSSAGAGNKEIAETFDDFMEANA